MNQYKLSKGEVERRKILMKSKNAAQVKNDFLQRDPNRAPTQAEIETELKRLQVNFIFNTFQPGYPYFIYSAYYYFIR